MSGPFTVRAYAPEDAERVAAFHRLVFGSEMTAEHYHWKLGRPTWDLGVASSFLAEKDDQLVGHYAGTTTTLRLDGHDVPAIHISDTMTHPDFRRQGVLSLLAPEAHRRWTEAGVGVAYGMPTKSWGTRGRFIGFEEGFPMGWRRLFLAPMTWVTRKDTVFSSVFDAPVRSWRGWQARQRGDIEAVPCSWDGDTRTVLDRLWAQECEGVAFSVVRDAAWIHQRYIEASHVPHTLWLAGSAEQPAGYAVTLVHRWKDARVVLIADLFAGAQNTRIQDALIRAIVRAALKDQSAEVRAVSGEHTWFDAALRRHGFIDGRGAYEQQLVQLAQPLPPSWAQGERWHLTAGDFDFV
ncbi:MAG: GNAT family N-acetyltransferase [Bacteroidota bacterium]